LTGTIEFSADEMTIATTETDKTLAHFLATCPMFQAAESSCEAMESQLKKTYSDASCTPNDGCWCTATVPVTYNETDKYAIQGNDLSFPATGRLSPFCVQEDTLMLWTGDDGLVFKRKTCTTDSDCTLTNKHCCAQATSADSRCEANACVLGAIGASCVSDAYCAQKRCANQQCAAPLKALQAQCSADSQCESNLCCLSPYVRLQPVCTDAGDAGVPGCPSVPGDPCTADTRCADGTCRLAPSGSGFCTNTKCGDVTCGYDSHGNASQCVSLKSSAPPYYTEECRPTCDGEYTCQAINPALHCFGVAGPLPPKP
jgi:hypothetical protein